MNILHVYQFWMNSISFAIYLQAYISDSWFIQSMCLLFLLFCYGAKDN